MESICRLEDVIKALKIIDDDNDKLVDKIASFFEKEENWIQLKRCYLFNDRSDDLRRLLYKAIKE